MKKKKIITNEIQGLTSITKRLINGQEGLDVDFKVKPDGVKAEDFVAFANGRGGIILVGVQEVKTTTGKQYGEIVGCAIDDKAKQSFISIASSCRPSIDITITLENIKTNKPIFRIDVSEGREKPYCTSSGTYKIRADGQNIAIDPPMMKAIILEKESGEFITRFKTASEGLLQSIAEVHSSLTEQIGRVEEAAQQAIEAANDAEQAAREAEDTASWAAYK